MGLTGGVPALRVSAVSYRYRGAGAHALTDVSLAVAGGDGVALLGGNGAGKTTLLRLAMALLQPDSGAVEVVGRATRGLHPEDIARDAGYLFQQPETQLFARTVEEEISFGLRQSGAEPDGITAAVEAVLAETGLSTLRDVHPYDLPAPMRRLVALAAVLAAGPALLLLDEPTAGLDRRTRAMVRDLVLARRRRGTAVVAVTHDGEFALEALDRGVVLERGRLAADGPIESVLGSGAALPVLPAPARLARALGLAPSSLRLEPVAAALAERCRRLPERIMFPEPGSPPSVT